ncbi:MAG: MFS transporter, partial [Akkermansiaceae bacterium]|nr:MFS transporter [Akkermansiaceae bacterium]
MASLGGLLFGFDTAVISGTVARVAGQFGLSDLQLGWFTSSALVGCIPGALGAGWLGDRFGRKPVLIAAAVLFFVSALFSAFPPGFNGLIAARMLGGIGVGMASVLGPMYISELAPPKWRGRLVACYQLS